MVMLIAEIGVNHNGSAELLTELIEQAKISGAHACKFQTFTADNLAKKDTPKVKYQLSTSDAKESHWQMLKTLEFSDEMHRIALAKCESLGLKFISTPYDPGAVNYLFDLGVKTVKTASADVVDHRLHKRIAELGMTPIIAVGMATLPEIKDMLEIYRNSTIQPTLLHCVSNYPCSHQSVNMACMNTLKAEFGCDIGYSDHSIDNTAAMLSVALGATIIEKHFTLNKNMLGPDHKASSTPDEFKSLADAVKLACLVMGSPIKKLQNEESQMHSVSRKSACIINSLKKGEIIDIENLTMLRPGGGIYGSDFYKLVGKKVNKDILAGSVLNWSDISDFN
jgi:N,N'-diacetyllegionaminate synthase